MTIVADTGALYALTDADDAWHGRVLDWWKVNRMPIVVPVTVLSEVTYLLQKRIGPRAESAFVRAVADGEFRLEALDDEDIERIPEIMDRYDDLPLGFVDASIVAIAERLDARDVLTTDRRHFSVVRPRHSRGLRLVP